jgi:hypothetical protein
MLEGVGGTSGRLLADEMVRRKLAKEPNAQLSAILREAVVQYLRPRG